MDALTRLILQRTRPYIALVGKAPLREWTRTGRTDHLAAELESRGAVLAFVTAANRELAADVEDIVERIAWRRPRRLLSIGPGGGHVEAALARRYALSAVLLVDIEAGGRGHGYGPNGAGYADLEAAATRVKIAAPECRVAIWNPNEAPEPRFHFDLCVSLYALGYHFPRAAYADFLAGNALPGAIEIYDDRDAGRRVMASPQLV